VSHLMNTRSFLTNIGHSQPVQTSRSLPRRPSSYRGARRHRRFIRSAIPNGALLLRRTIRERQNQDFVPRRHRYFHPSRSAADWYQHGLNIRQSDPPKVFQPQFQYVALRRRHGRSRIRAMFHSLRSSHRGYRAPQIFHDHRKRHGYLFCRHCRSN
jgi:hypothetical protein